MPDDDKNIVKASTGESITGLAALLAGAITGPWLAENTIGRFSPLGPNANTVLGGAALAYFTSGLVQKYGQGAAIIGAVGLLREHFPAITPGEKTADQSYVMV